MKLLNCIKERIAEALPLPAKKLLEYTAPKGEKKAIQAPSIAEYCLCLKIGYESTMPLSLRSNANVEKANEALKSLKAKGVYKTK